MLEMLKIILIGIIEGITEWLPISSTGHMLLFDAILNIKMSPEFKDVFMVVIQLGAILAVVVIYWRKLWPFFKDEEMGGKIAADKSILLMWLKVIVGSIPVMIVGLLLDDWIDAKMHNSVVIAIALIVYGVWFILIENKNRADRERGIRARVRKMDKLTYKDALIIGLFQVLSLIPGTSRSGATIIGGLQTGISRTVSAEFTFFLGIPAMFGASLLKLIKLGFHFSAHEFLELVIGMVVSFFVSVVVIRFLMGYIKKHDFKVFGFYRIGLGVIVLIVALVKAIMA